MQKGFSKLLIKFSKYNSPFCEPSTCDVHYISLDDQRLMRLGLFTAHVDCYLQNSVCTFEAFDAIHNVNYIFESSKLPFSQTNSSPKVEAVMGIPDREFLDDLYLNFGIKAAGKRGYRCF